MTTIARETTSLDISRPRRSIFARGARISILALTTLREGLRSLARAGQLGSSAEVEIGRSTGARI